MPVPARDLPRRVALNTAVVLAGQLLSSFLALVVVLVLARGLGPEQYGAYAFGFAVATGLGGLALAGVQHVTVRRLIGHPERAPETVGAAMGALALIVLVVGAIAAMVLAVVPLDPELRRAGMASLLWLVPLPLLAGQPVYHARLDLRVPLAIGAIFLALWAGLAFVLSGRFPHVPALLVAWGLLRTVECVVQYVHAQRTYGRPARPQKSAVKDIVRHGMPHSLSLTLRNGITGITIVALAAMAGSLQAGIFAPAAQLMVVISLPVSAVMVSLFPLMVARPGEKAQASRRRTQLAFRYTLILVSLAAAYLYASAPLAIVTTYTAAYLDAFDVLRILAPVAVLRAFQALTERALAANDRQAWALPISAAAALMHVALLALLIPGHGAVGAAWAMLWSTLLWVGLALVVPATRRVGWDGLKASAPALFVGGGLVGALELLHPVTWSALVASLLLLPVYVLVLWVLGALRPADLRLARQALARREPQGGVAD